MIRSIGLTRHAIERWVSRALGLGLDPSTKALITTLERAHPDTSKVNSTRWNLFRRSILHGSSLYVVADGWRFVIAGDKCIEIERVKPHENYLIQGADMNRAEFIEKTLSLCKQCWMYSSCFVARNIERSRGAA